MRAVGKHKLNIMYEVCMCSQGYSWLKDKILSEEGRRQQTKLREIAEVAEKIGCSLSQLAIGNFVKKYYSIIWYIRHCLWGPRICPLFTYHLFCFNLHIQMKCQINQIPVYCMAKKYTDFHYFFKVYSRAFLDCSSLLIVFFDTKNKKS